jgi:hypothetical protein
MIASRMVTQLITIEFVPAQRRNPFASLVTKPVELTGIGPYGICDQTEMALRRSWEAGVKQDPDLE